jgi:hypothetical protein
VYACNQQCKKYFVHMSSGAEVNEVVAPCQVFPPPMEGSEVIELHSESFQGTDTVPEGMLHCPAGHDVEDTVRYTRSVYRLYLSHGRIGGKHLARSLRRTSCTFAFA